MRVGSVGHPECVLRIHEALCLSELLAIPLPMSTPFIYPLSDL